jgi:hypothetical protein
MSQEVYSTDFLLTKFLVILPSGISMVKKIHELVEYEPICSESGLFFSPKKNCRKYLNKTK